jgi:hypothetical protein
MTKLFEVTLKNGTFKNCSIEYSIGIIQICLTSWGIFNEITIPMFWDIVFKRYYKLPIKINELILDNQINIKRLY